MRTNIVVILVLSAVLLPAISAESVQAVWTDPGHGVAGPARRP